MEHNLHYLFSWVAKRVLLGLFIQLSVFSAVFAADASERFQSIRETKVTLSLTKVSLREFIREVESGTPFQFTFDEQETLNGNPSRISIRMKNESLEKVLERVAANTGLEFKQVNNNIHVRLRKGSGPEASLSTSLPTAPAALTVTGKVNDDKGDGLPGVTVALKGTSLGMSTDVTGSYSLNIPDGQENGTLVFSYIGYIAQEIAVGNRTTINVILRPDLKALDEVVVIGYGAVQRKDLTGAVGSVGSAEIKDLAVTRVDQALLGKVAGVQVKAVSGAPGAAPQIRIRGIGSISAGSGPLFVVDGFPTDNIQTLNPNDIESLDILKDASATAIYGSRGANGVIIINTKRGKAGKPTITFDTFYGLQQVSRIPETMNSRELAQYALDGMRNRNLDAGRISHHMEISNAPNSNGCS
jgi:TonB-dependent SusC/RagA subfamily outer membrane receptor